MVDYSTLGTTVMRKETPRDHQILRRIMNRRWPEIRDFCYRDPEAIREWQFGRIQQLVDHAFGTVPLYREKYSAAGFKPGDLRTWNDFERLPVLTKGELIDGFPEKSVSGKHNLEFTTRSSGSSGQFVTVVVSPDAVYEDTVQGVRQFWFQNGGNYQPDDLALFIYTCPWWVSSVDGDYRTEFLPTTTRIGESMRRIRELRPKILSTYPTYLRELAAEGADLKGSGVELVVIHSEQSSIHERRELSQQFGIPVLDEYSSEELTRISLECPSRRYHLEEDACYAEIVDQDDLARGLSNGEIGLVVGTNLLNEGTPIIRYCQGDLATIIGNQRCECGSNFRVISSPKGRKMDSIIVPPGRGIPAGAFMDLAYNWYLEAGIPVHGLKYKIVQEETGDVDVFIVPGLYPFTDRMSELVRESMYSLLPREVGVNVHVVDDLPFQKGNKYRPVISLYGCK